MENNELEKNEISSNQSNIDLNTNNVFSNDEVVNVADTNEGSSLDNEVTTELDGASMNNDNSFIDERKKGNKKPFVILAVIILALAVGLYFGYTKLFSTKEVFKRTVNSGYKQFEKILDNFNEERNNNKSSYLKTETDIKVDLNSSLIDKNTQNLINEINKLKFNTEIGIDYKNESLKGIVSTKYQNQDLLGVATYLSEEKLYIELKNLYDKYIELSDFDFSKLMDKDKEKGINIEDVKYFTSKTKDVFINSISNKDFEKSKEKIKLNGKDVKTTKVSLEMDSEKLVKIIKKSIKKLKNDKKYIKSLSNILGKDEKEIKHLFDSVKTDEEDDIDNDIIIVFSAYTKGIRNEIVGYEFTIKEMDESNTISFACLEDGKINVKLTSEDTTIELNITKKENGNKKTYTYELKSEIINFNGSYEINEKTNTDDKYEADIKLTIRLNLTGMDVGSITLNGKISENIVDKLDMPKFTNTISSNELNDVEILKIRNKLMTNRVVMSFISNLSGYNF